MKIKRKSHLCRGSAHRCLIIQSIRVPQLSRIPACYIVPDRLSRSVIADSRSGPHIRVSKREISVNKAT